MKKWIALFRGINVGGKNLLPMQGLRTRFERLGANDVKTYIQSGNVVFGLASGDARKLPERLRAGIRKDHGFEPHVIILGLSDLEKAIRANPFSEAESDPRRVHLFFLDSVPKRPDMDTLETISASGERFELRGRVFYLYAPGGIGRSKLAARAEKALGVPATARNWRTVRKLEELAGGG